MAETCCSVKREKTVFFETLNYKIVSLSISAVALVLSFLWGGIIGDNHLLMYFNTGWIAVVLCGIPLFANALENLFKFHKIKSSLLISVSMLACIALEIFSWVSASGATHGHSESYLFAAGEVAFLMMIGELLEDITVKRSRSGIEKLINLAPKMANINMNGMFISMPVSFVKVDDIVLVKPYEQISVDGVIVKGDTSVNQSAITGESLPLDRSDGDNVYAGTWNNHGAIEIKVTKLSTETTVARMAQLVKEAEMKKAPINNIADKWAGIIVPMAMTLSVVVFLINLLFKVDFTQALVRGVTVLVVFCPCSLALATPTAIAAGIGNASYRGILIKSGLALETMSSVNAVVFDKTGTLTTGEIRVEDYVTDVDEKQFFSYLLTAESSSEHPLAKAIVEYSKHKGELYDGATVSSVVGSGVEAKFNGKTVSVGKDSDFNSEKYASKLASWKHNGNTVVGVSVDNVTVGFVALSDTVKSTAKSTVKALNAMGVKTVMFTGDNKYSAQSVTEELGIKDFKHSQLPQDKVDNIELLKKEGNKVCMVGDGVNDAPALAAADCSIAMGAMGSDVALEVADVALMTDSVEKIPGLLQLANKTLSTIKRNIIIAMSINFVAVILSALGLLNPVLGALVHNCSSVFVVASSAMLLTVKDKSGLTTLPKNNAK